MTPKSNEITEECILFDAAWYLRCYPEVANALKHNKYQSAFQHYLLRGIKNRYNPNPIFNEVWYQTAYPDIALAIEAGEIVCGAEHYLRLGCKEGRSCSQFFNPSSYSKQYPEVLLLLKDKLVKNEYEHFVKFGLAEGTLPGPDFNTDAYIRTHPKALERSKELTSPSLFHYYIHYGEQEGFSYRALEGEKFAFDEEWYLEANNDVRKKIKSGKYKNGLDHYLKRGIRESRDPNFFFQEKWYRKTYPDIGKAIKQGSLLCAAEHFISHGCSENRQPSPFFDPKWYCANYPEVHKEMLENNIGNCFQHFLAYGLKNGLMPSHFFDKDSHFFTNADLSSRTWRNFSEYIKHKRSSSQAKFIDRKELTPEQVCFDEDWYKNYYPKVGQMIKSGRYQSGFEHYLKEGIKLKLNPNPIFDERWYVNYYSDIRKALKTNRFICGAEHYALVGCLEHRKAGRFFDPDWYLEEYSTIKQEIKNNSFWSPYHHFLKLGLNKGLLGSADFNEEEYLLLNPEVAEQIRAGKLSSGLAYFVQNNPKNRDKGKTTFLRDLIRLKDWWSYKLSPLLAFAYFLILAGAIPAKDSLQILAAVFFYMIGTAAFGFYLNDLADIRVDLEAGKKNMAAKLSPTERILALTALLFIPLLPWFFLKITPLLFILICAEILCFILYSFEPWRLKNSAASIVIDTLYAHVIPTAVISLVFWQYTSLPSQKFLPLFILVIIWQFVLGLRNIITHQIVDFQNDLRSRSHTFVRRFGITNALKLNNVILPPLEALLFISILFSSTEYIPGIVTIFFLCILTLALKYHWLWKEPIKPSQNHYFSNRYLNEFYDFTLPILILIYLTFNNSAFIWLFLLHLIFFKLPPSLLDLKKDSENQSQEALGTA